MHKLNIILIGSFLILLIANLYLANKLKVWKQKKQTLSISVAKNHPMIAYVTLIAANGKEHFQYEYNHHYANWDYISSSNLDMFKMPIPDSLLVTWVSLRENKAFKGQFTFPKKEISKLIADKNINNKYRNTIRYGIGIAPEGKIGFWLKLDDNKQVLINNYEAKLCDIKSIIGYDDINDFLNESNHIRFNDSIINSPAELGKWQKVQKKYSYNLMLKDFPDETKKVIISFFNGEKTILNYTEQKEFILTAGVPKHISIHFNKKERLSYTFPDNMMDRFNTKNKEIANPDTLSFTIQLNTNNNELKTFVGSGKK